MHWEELTYCVNRPSYHNLDCVSLSAVILLAYLGQRGMTFVKERKWKHWEEMDLAGVVNGTLGLACAAAVLAMSTGTVLQFSQNSKIKENYHNVSELEAFVQEIAEVVPENTHGFGLNVVEIYSLLHYPVLYHGFQRYGGDSGILTGVTGTADRGGCTVCIYQSVVTAYLGAE